MSLYEPHRYGGMRIIESANALKETTERLFPESRHRSRRIWKKLIKRFGAEFRKAPCAFQVGDALIVHPTIAAQMRARMKWVEM